MTTALQLQYWDPQGGHGSVDWPLYIYGGTTADLYMVGQSMRANNEASIGALLIFDAPLSLVADTILLPICIYQQVEVVRNPRSSSSPAPGDPASEGDSTTED